MAFPSPTTPYAARAGQEIGYDATIEGKPDGSLEFTATATPTTDFLTARTGFVVLHPLTGVAGRAVEIEHVDGTVEKSKFPELVNPVQPVLHIRSLTHEVLPGLKATVRMEGDTYEMEDHRNWTDASFKTYVRPLALPWPYTLKAGESIKQSIKLSLSGAAPAGAKGRGAKGVEVELGATLRETVPPIGLGMPAEEIDPTIATARLAATHRPEDTHLPPGPASEARAEAAIRVSCTRRAKRRGGRAGNRGREHRQIQGRAAAGSCDGQAVRIETRGSRGMSCR